MDWLKALLKAAGLDDAAIDALIGDVNKELPKHFIPKDKYNEAVEAKKKAEKDVTDRDTQITELGKTAGLSEELKQQIATLTAANTAAAEQHAAEMKELQLSNAIKSALAGKVHDEGIASGLVDRAKLVLDGDKVVGLDEQVTALKTSHAFMFKEDKADPNQKPPGFHVGGAGNSTPPAAGASLKDALAAHFQAKS
ncbi:phage scaffolding protein [Paenibacillus pinihumi]|uniref:phage scaffolding protein n=1 Tax=Paenibacillus pinihumi TaxID=669462 RepID=UPI0003F73D1F|nr:phage scaffolding protein [Paenibacillus pinihumi]